MGPSPWRDPGLGNGSQKHENVITTTGLRVTVAAQCADTWVGETI